ncbi:vomeronasal receptor 4, partial [Sigmodon hispidus]
MVVAALDQWNEEVAKDSGSEQPAGVRGVEGSSTGFRLSTVEAGNHGDSGSNRLFYVGAFINMSEINQMKVTKYCSLFPMNYIIKGLILTVTTSRDVFVVGVMLSTSAYMIIILCRHQRQCKHLHNITHPRASPEKRATQVILLLVVIFVIMYWMDFLISATAVLLWTYDPVILTVQKFVMNVYPTITPLVQFSSDIRVINMLKNMQLYCHFQNVTPR